MEAGMSEFQTAPSCKQRPEQAGPRCRGRAKVAGNNRIEKGRGQYVGQGILLVQEGHSE